jgi:hypothetical protein
MIKARHSRRWALLLFGLTATSTVPAAQACVADAMEHLKRHAPEGYVIHDKLQRKADFTRWITCDDVHNGLATAVHEGVHILTEEINAYPLINGQTAQRVAPSARLFPPRNLAGLFRARSSFVQTYLKPGAATSAEEFGFLLDEMNAYTHDLNASIKLTKLMDPNRDVYHRDGLAALMAFTAAYVDRAKDERTETWTALQAPAVRKTVNILWSQAERVMGASCRTPRYALETPDYLAPICSANISHGLGELLGRPPLCPVSCLKSLADAKARAASGAQTTPR